jgi:hypothetical protein
MQETSALINARIAARLRVIGTAWWRQRWAIGCVLAIAAGIMFRLIWIEDVEYKSDEAWTFLHVQDFWQTRHLPLVGMESSGGIPNCGMSLWVFIALSTIVPFDDPLALTRVVQLVNIASILLLAMFVLTSIEPSEREPWLWSVALVSVNPLAVLFSRKIWAPDILPLFATCMLIGWRYRHQVWGSFLFGLLGALLGQIQLDGFFFAAAFVCCTLAFDRCSVRWSAWFAGSILGVLPLIPWLAVLSSGNQHMSGASFPNPLLPVIHWFSMALGIDLHYSLGGSFRPFLAYPTIAGTPIYLTTAFLCIIILIFSILVIRLAFRLRVQPAGTIRRLVDVSSTTWMALTAAFCGYGLLLIAIMRPIDLHYWTIAFSLPMLSLAKLGPMGSNGDGASIASSRCLLSTLVLAQACLTMSFLGYVHETKFIKGDYGIVYRAQTHPFE